MLRRRLPAIACAAGAVLVLAACTSPDAAPSSTPSASTASVVPGPSASSPSAVTSTPAPSVSASAAEQRYLGFVQQFNQNLASTPPGVLVLLGRQVCDGFRDGQDAGAVSQGLGDSTLAPDLQAEDAAVIIGAAVATLCPQYRSKLQSDADSAG